MEAKETSASSGYARLREDNWRKPSSWTFQRQIVVFCLVLVLVSLCGLLGGVIALRIHLQFTKADLLQNEGQLFAYETVIKNLTAVFENGKVDNGRSRSSSTFKDPSVVYHRWGTSSCPKTSQLIYQGVTASASSNIVGGGSNHLCMTLEPDFISPRSGRQGGRSYIFGVEYRNGEDFTPMANLHGHDAPCAACLAPGRSNVLMVPGTTTCPTTGGNWTREYFGYLMAARKDYKRSSYICVDANAESTIGSRESYQQGGLLFPVEAYCNTNAGGGLPCAPYADGYEVTCAVCTL